MRWWMPAIALAVAAAVTACDQPPEADPPTTSPSPTAEVAEPPREIEPFDEPAQLADVLGAAEVALADPATSDAQGSLWARAQQQAYRDLAAHPDWEEEVRPLLPEPALEPFDLNLHAAVQLHALTSPQPELPTGWRIESPPPVAELRGYYDETEAESGVPWHVLAAINFVETRFGRIHGDSHAGAQGPMQFMPPTWQAYGEGDVNDPRDAIHAAGRYLAANGAPDDLRGALFAYNRSERYVEAILAYAEAMARFDLYLDTYHRWQVYYRTEDGDFILEEGYGT